MSEKKILIEQSRRDRANELIQIMRSIGNIDATTQSRERVYVVARAMIAKVLIAEGCTTIEVGAMLGRNHATISHYKDLLDNFLTSPGYNAERELWTKFTNQINY